MTRLEAQQRNWNIGNLMGQLPRLKKIIPADQPRTRKHTNASSAEPGTNHYTT